LPLGGDSGGGVRGPDRGVQVDGDPGLRRGGGGFQLFEGADLVDPLGVRHIAPERDQAVDPVGYHPGIQ
jgi:hypothetical protein